MDVDEIQPTRYSPFINFFDVSNNFPWQEPRPEQIRDRRTMMDGTLIFDILLDSGGVDATYMVYPPENQEGLQKLLDAIESSQYDTLKKDCLVYFLLKWHQDGRERNFQLQRCIPPQFAALADAYWHLDTGINVARAVALLSDARLNRDYASKIIRAISLSQDSAALIRRYVQTAKPQLVEPLDLEQYVVALAESSVLETWQFLRTFNENETDDMRARLLKKILAWAVSPTPRPNALKELLTLPLSNFEESVLWTFAETPPSTLKFPEVAILQDLICVRLIQAGRYPEAIKRDRLYTSKTSPKNLRLTKDRSKMVNEVYAALATVERSLLDLELDPTIQQKSPLLPKPVSPPMRRPAAQESQEPQNTSLSQAWEDLQMPDSLLNKSTPLREVRVPVTPTFGGPSQTSTPGTGPPILPINFNSIASGSTTRKSFSLSSSLLGSSQPRTSLSGVGSRMAYGNTSAVSSPVSGIKLPAAPSAPHAPQTPTFVSASRQPNAFYQPPPPKTNGVKRAFEEDITRSPEPANTSANTVNHDIEMESEKEATIFEAEKRRGRKSAATDNGDEENPLQYSVFGGNKETEKEGTPPAKRATRKAPPGSFMSDNEDAMDEDYEEESSSRKRTSRSTTRPSKSQTISKPPAKKPRQSKETRTIPGGIMDEGELEEEMEDEVAPLRAPSPKRPLRKARSSVSAEMTDDGEGMQTRRRSSRLTTGGSAHGGSPEPPATKSKKTTRTSGTRKKR